MHKMPLFTTDYRKPYSDGRLDIYAPRVVFPPDQFEETTSLWPDLLAKPTDRNSSKYWEVPLEGLTLKMRVAPQLVQENGRVANHIVSLHFDIQVDEMIGVDWEQWQCCRITGHETTLPAYAFKTASPLFPKSKPPIPPRPKPSPSQQALQDRDVVEAYEKSLRRIERAGQIENGLWIVLGIGSSLVLANLAVLGLLICRWKKARRATAGRSKSGSFNKSVDEVVVPGGTKEDVDIFSPARGEDVDLQLPRPGVEEAEAKLNHVPLVNDENLTNTAVGPPRATPTEAEVGKVMKNCKVVQVGAAAPAPRPPPAHQLHKAGAAAGGATPKQPPSSRAGLFKEHVLTMEDPAFRNNINQQQQLVVPPLLFFDHAAQQPVVPPPGGAAPAAVFLPPPVAANVKNRAEVLEVPAAPGGGGAPASKNVGSDQNENVVQQQIASHLQGAAAGHYQQAFNIPGGAPAAAPSQHQEEQHQAALFEANDPHALTRFEQDQLKMQKMQQYQNYLQRFGLGGRQNFRNLQVNANYIGGTESEQVAEQVGAQEQDREAAALEAKAEAPVAVREIGAGRGTNGAGTAGAQGYAIESFYAAAAAAQNVRPSAPVLEVEATPAGHGLTEESSFIPPETPSGWERVQALQGYSFG